MLKDNRFGAKFDSYQNTNEPVKKATSDDMPPVL